MKVLVIANYFGKPPACFQLWLDSISYNPMVKWMFLTDIQDGQYAYPPNLKVVHTSFLEMKARFEKKMGYETCYTTPYRFCQFKPVLGYVFSEELAGVDYWGWTDCDLIYGDLSEVLSRCDGVVDKVFRQGHLSFIRAEPGFNKMIALHPLTHQWLCKGSLKRGNFDEDDLPNIILPEVNAKVDYSLPFANFYPRHGHFTLCETPALLERLGLEYKVIAPLPCVFTFVNGRIVGWFALPKGEVKCVEVSYVHFLKRHMEDRACRLKCDCSYLIKPNSISEYDGHALSWKEIRSLNHFRIHWDYIKKRMNFQTIFRKLGLTK